MVFYTHVTKSGVLRGHDFAITIADAHALLELYKWTSLIGSSLSSTVATVESSRTIRLELVVVLRLARQVAHQSWPLCMPWQWCSLPRCGTHGWIWVIKGGWVMVPLVACRSTEQRVACSSRT